MDFPDLQSKRLLIRLTQAFDTERYVLAMRDSHLALNPEIYAQRKSLRVGPDQILFDLYQTDDTKIFVGGLSLRFIDGERDRIELGYWILPEFTRMGLISEAVLSLSKAIFEAGVVKKIELHCDERNQKSQRVAQNLGFRPEAIWSGKDGETGEFIRRIVWAAYGLGDLISRPVPM